MNKIEIIFYILASFFEVGNPRIAAENTTITIFPNKKEILINQTDLFAIIQTDKDRELTIKQWNKISNQDKRQLQWSNHLKNFPAKDIFIDSKNNIIKVQLRLRYNQFKDLEIFGIWYDEEQNELSINHIPELYIKTSEGQLVNNYWYFDLREKFSFELSPDINQPEHLKKFKIPLKEFLRQE